MKKILSIFLLILLVNCTTTPSVDKIPKSPVDNVIDVFKSIPFPTMQLTIHLEYDILKYMKLNLTSKLQQKLIDNAFSACNKAQSKWSQKFWFGVWKKLCQRYKKGIH